MQYGIEALCPYVGQVYVDARTIVAGRGLDEERLANVQQIERSVGLGCEDPVTNAVNAARPIVSALGSEADRIEMVIVSTESGVDYSKSIASYVHRYLELSARCRLMEVKQACYAATGMLQLALGYLSAGLSPGAKILLIATDIALVDARAGYSEVSTGFGAVALLLSDQPKLLRIDLGAFGLNSYETRDSARPTATMDVADVDRSLFAYLDCLSSSFAHYGERVDGADFGRSFAYLAMHTPFPGIVKAGHRKLMREQCGGVDAAEIQRDFDRRTAPSLDFPKRVGNLCSGSLYLALASLVEHRRDDGPARIGLFSYGSGCASEFFSGVLGSTAREAIAGFNISEKIDRRTAIDFPTYERLSAAANQILIPKADHTVDIDEYMDYLPDRRDPILIFTGTDGYYRSYDWV